MPFCFYDKIWIIRCYGRIQRDKISILVATPNYFRHVCLVTPNAPPIVCFVRHTMLLHKPLSELHIWHIFSHAHGCCKMVLKRRWLAKVNKRVLPKENSVSNNKIKRNLIYTKFSTILVVVIFVKENKLSINNQLVIDW